MTPNESEGKERTKLESRYIDDRDGYFSEEQRTRTRKKNRRMSDTVLERLRTTRNRPRTMTYFDGIVAYDGDRITELREFHEEGGTIIGTLCAMVPVEIIHALGAKSVRISSGYYECVHPTNELLGDAGLCPLVKSTLGAKMLSAHPVMDLLDLVVAPATCDGKMKLAEMLEDWVPVLMLNVPRVKTGDTTSRLWLDEMKYLIRNIEELTENRLRKSSLLKEIRRWNSANQAWNELMELRTPSPPLLSGQDAMIVAQASEIDDISRWTGKVGELIQELQDLSSSGAHAGEVGGARVMVGGSPIIFPNFKIPLVIEESGGIIVLDELCSATRILNDPVIVDETNVPELIRAIAERYFYPCTCPCFSPNDERIRRLREAIHRYDIEGVVFHMLRGCHLNIIEGTKIELVLDIMKVPMLKLESEYDEGDIEQIRTRVEAFVEMIKARRAIDRKKKKQ